MVLKKEDFYDLDIFELMQNVWCYTDTVVERGEKTWQFIYDYCHWCEEILQEKWPEGNELPPCNFVIDKLKKQENEFYPGLIDNDKKFIEFSRKVKKAMN